MVPEISCTTDRTFCQFVPFFALLPPPPSPLPPPNNQKNQNFDKMKKQPGDIISLYMYTIKDNHMMYGS